MNAHSCDWCKDSKNGHVMCVIHGRDSQECCYCNPSIAIPILEEPYITIALRIKEQQEETDDCCYLNLDSVLDDVIQKGIRSRSKKEII